MALTSNFHFSEEKRHQTVGNSVRDRTSQARPLKRIVFHFLLKNSERNLKHGHAGGWSDEDEAFEHRELVHLSFRVSWVIVEDEGLRERLY